MITSQFKERFQRFSEGGPKGRLYGGNLLLEILKLPEPKSKGGIILSAPSTHAYAEFKMHLPTIAIVLEVGAGFFDSDKNEDVPLDVQIGNVIWISDLNPRFLTAVPGLIEAVPEKQFALGSIDGIIKKWESLEDFHADMKLLEDCKSVQADMNLLDSAKGGQT